MRFTHPELYEGREDFARFKALEQILERGIVKRGMTTQQVQTILGRSEYEMVKGDDGDWVITSKKGVRRGEAFAWSYGQLFGSGLRIEFNSEKEISRILWHFDTSDTPNNPKHPSNREY